MSYTKLYYHIVFGTKKRVPTMTPDIRPRLYAYIAGIIRKAKGWPVEIGGVEDHIHILTTIHPTMNVADFMRIVKSSSSKWLNEQPEMKINFRWQIKYGAFSVSERQLKRVQRYVQNQEEHHRKVSWEEEFVHFLEEYEIAYQPQYLWE